MLGQIRAAAVDEMKKSNHSTYDPAAVAIATRMAAVSQVPSSSKDIRLVEVNAGASARPL